MKKTIKILLLGTLLLTGCSNTPETQANESSEAVQVQANQLQTETFYCLANEVEKQVNNWLSTNDYEIYDIQYDLSHSGSFGYALCTIIYYVK